MLLRQPPRVERRARHLGELFEKLPVGAPLLQQRRLGLHDQGLAAGLLAIARRAHLHTDLTTRAVFGCHGDGEGLAGKVGIPGRRCGIAGRRRGKGSRIAHLGADRRMGAHHHALAALHAQIALPHRHRFSQVAFLEPGRARGPGAITGEGADRQAIALVGQQRQDHLPFKRREHFWSGRSLGLPRSPSELLILITGLLVLVKAEPVETGQLSQRAVHGLKVARHHSLTLVAIAGLNAAADLGQRRVEGQHPTHRKETDLHHRVDAGAQTRLTGNPVGIDHPDDELTLADLAAQRRWQTPPGLERFKRAVEQQLATLNNPLQQVDLLQQRPLVAGHQGGPLDQVRGADRLGPEAQMGNGVGAGFLGVVDEIALHLQRGAVTDNPDRGFVGADGAIGAQAVDDRAHLAGLAHKGRIPGQRAMAEVISNAHREMVERGFTRLQLGQHRRGHRRGEFLGTEAVAPADHPRQRQLAMVQGPGLRQGRHHIEVQGLTGRTGFFATIQHGHRLS